MENISDTLSKKQLSVVNCDKLNKPTGQLSVEEINGCDIGLSDYRDLMSPDFYAWYCKAWYKIGRDRFHILASQARSDGRDPARLFSRLVKAELAK